MRIRPTELGLKGVLLLCALDVAFLATSYSNLFFLLLLFCCTLGALGLFWTVRNVRTVHVELIDAPAAAAGEPREVRVGVRQAVGKAAFDLAVKVTFADTCTEVLHLPVLRNATVATATLAPLPRGVHAVQRLQLVSRFPFGLFQVTRTVTASAELVTFPRPLLPAELAAPGGESEGEFLAPRVGHRSHSIAGLRPFRTGDATADIHWKASARRGQPIVKERELEVGDTVELVIDRRCSEAELERALSIATTALQQAQTDDRPVQLRSQDYSASLAGGRRSPALLLRWLAAATTLPADAAAPPRGGAGAVQLPRRRSPEASRA